MLHKYHEICIESYATNETLSEFFVDDKETTLDNHIPTLHNYPLYNSKSISRGSW